MPISKRDLKYTAAVKLMENGDYDAAITAFEDLGQYKDSAEQLEKCKEALKDIDY